MRLAPLIGLTIDVATAGSQQSPARLRREVSDPGVIATNQRVSPAGLQTVLEGRVTGVRFGRTPAELWVAVPGSAFLLDWSANRVLARGTFDGRSGVHGVA